MPSLFSPHLTIYIYIITQQQNTEEENEGHSGLFLFESGEWSDDDSTSSDNDEESGADEAAGGHGGQQHTNNNESILLPSETQLTLLCLDYLRDLRRSYQYNDDLLNAEGLDGDYIALAVWALSRAFVKPNKLVHPGRRNSTNNNTSGEGDVKEYNYPKISNVKEITGKGKRTVELIMYGGGGLGGIYDTPVGNDNTYRQLDEDEDWNIPTNNNERSKNIFALSEKISLPTMEDITNEVLLRHPNEEPFGIPKKVSKGEEEESEEEDDDEPYYEHNDNHYSNSHRFYLLNGLASDATSTTGFEGGRGLTSPKEQVVSIHGLPLTMAEIASAGLTSLRAKSRIEAEKEMIYSPLFQQFVKAASAGGFFQEKKRGEVKKSSSPMRRDKKDDDDAEAEEILSPEEEERKSRFYYEEKYRRVVNKFRSKLATKEAAQLLQQPNQQQNAATSPYHAASPSRLNSAYRIMSGNASVSSAGGGYTVDSIINVIGVTERQRRRRERRIDRVKSKRTLVTFEEEKKADWEEKAVAPVSPSAAAPTGDKPQAPDSSSNKLSDEMSSKLKLEEDYDQEEQLRTKVESKAAKPPPSPAAKLLPHYQEAEKLNTTGNSLMQQKQFQQALDTYTAALQLAPAGPNSHVYYSNRSAAYLSLNQYESSISDSEKSLALSPEYAKAYSRLGLAYFACGRYSEAVGAYEHSLKIDPENTWTGTHLQKAKEKLLSDNGDGSKKEEGDAENVDHPAATKEVEKDGAVDEEDNWPTPFEDGKDKNEEKTKKDGVTTAKEEEETTKQSEEERIAEQTRQADSHKDKGNEHMAKKEFDEALNQYNLAIETSPSGPHSHVYYSNRAAAYCYLANYVAATTDCETSIQLNPTYEKAHARLGLSLFFRGEYADAIAAYKNSLELDPNNKASLSYMKKAKARLEEQEKKEEEERRKIEEERERTRKRMEWMEQQRQYQQQNQQQQQADDGEGSLGDNTGITSTGLTSIVTNDNEHDLNESVEVVPTAALSTSRETAEEAFDPFVTTDD